MAVALILDFPGGTKDQYDAVVEKMELGGRMAPGGLFHAAGSYEGGWRVIDVWEEVSLFERFRDEKIMPLTQEMGMQPPQVRAIEVAQQRDGTGAAPVLVQAVHLPGLDAGGFADLDGKVLPDGRSPDGLTFHVNGPEGDGWCVVDAWDSAEARDRFLEDRVRPAAENSSLTGLPEIQDLGVEATLGERSAAAA
jgi:hypothetical protein